MPRVEAVGGVVDGESGVAVALVVSGVPPRVVTAESSEQAPVIRAREISSVGRAVARIPGRLRRDRAKADRLCIIRG